VRYEAVAEAYRDLEAATGRLALIDRMAELRATPDDELARVCYLCQGLIAPEFARIDLGLAERLAIRAVATAVGVEPDAVSAAVRARGGDLTVSAVAPASGRSTAFSTGIAPDPAQQSRERLNREVRRHELPHHRQERKVGVLREDSILTAEARWVRSVGGQELAGAGCTPGSAATAAGAGVRELSGRTLRGHQ
jgi:hypothetical protein